jgi:hypothetical protein
MQAARGAPLSPDAEGEHAYNIVVSDTIKPFAHIP